MVPWCSETSKEFSLVGSEVILNDGAAVAVAVKATNLFTYHIVITVFTSSFVGAEFDLTKKQELKTEANLEMLKPAVSMDSFPLYTTRMTDDVFFLFCSHWSKQKLQSGKLYLHNVGTCSCLDFSSTICTQWSDPPHRVCFWCAADDFSLSYIKTNRACCVVQPAHNLTTKYWIRE